LIKIRHVSTQELGLPIISAAENWLSARGLKLSRQFPILFPL
jgi:hypothetical protein